MVVRIDEFAEKPLAMLLEYGDCRFFLRDSRLCPRGTQDTAQTEQSPPEVVSPVIAVSPRVHP